MSHTTTHLDEEIHISEGEAVRDFARVLALVRSGARVVIDSESDNQTIAVISPPDLPMLSIGPDGVVTAITSESALPVVEATPIVPPSRKLSEVIALLPENSPAVMDADFAQDVEEAIASHREPLKSAWE